MFDDEFNKDKILGSTSMIALEARATPLTELRQIRLRKLNNLSLDFAEERQEEDHLSQVFSTENSVDLILKNDFSTTSLVRKQDEHEPEPEVDKKKSLILDFEMSQFANESAPVKLQIGKQFDSESSILGFQRGPPDQSPISEQAHSQRDLSKFLLEPREGLSLQSQSKTSFAMPNGSSLSQRIEADFKIDLNHIE